MARWKNLQAGFATSKLHLSAPKEKAPEEGPRKGRGGRNWLPQSPDQSICLCLWLNSNKGQGFKVLIFLTQKSSKVHIVAEPLLAGALEQHR